MPRPNNGPELRFVPKRGRYYVRWFARGQERLRSTGTDSREGAEQVLAEFRARHAHLHPRQPNLDLPTSPEPSRASIVYFIGGAVGAIKIGVTTHLRARLKAFRIASPIPLEVLATVDGSADVEREYHQRFAAHRLRGKWFERHPDILAEIARLSAHSEHGGI